MYLLSMCIASSYYARLSLAAHVIIKQLQVSELGKYNKMLVFISFKQRTKSECNWCVFGS